MKSFHNYCFYTLGGDSDSSSEDSSSLSNVAVIAIACVVSIIVTLLSIVLFIVAYIFVKKKFPGIFISKQPVVCDTVGLPNQTSNTADIKLEPNPAYDTNHNVVMDTNPTDDGYLQVISN